MGELRIQAAGEINFLGGAVVTNLVQLSLQHVGADLVLTWPNAAFSLQAAPPPAGPFTNVPGAVSPYTNALPGPAQFFRLAYP